MKFNTTLEKTLETLPPEILNRMMLWYASSQEEIEVTSRRLQAVLADVQQVDCETCLAWLHQNSLSELIEYTLRNEFGPSYDRRACFHGLAEQIRKKLSEN